MTPSTIDNPRQSKKERIEGRGNMKTANEAEFIEEKQEK